MNAVHPPHPFHLIFCLECLGNAFCFFHLLDHVLHPFLAGLLDLAQVGIQLAGQYQLIVDNGPMNFLMIIRSVDANSFADKTSHFLSLQAERIPWVHYK